eukprot:3120016-Pyramimonas_sp.AAC.1
MHPRCGAILRPHLLRHHLGGLKTTLCRPRSQARPGRARERHLGTAQGLEASRGGPGPSLTPS